MKTTQGDLLRLFEQGEFDIIVHGCNCFHAMSAGIAGQIARKYPQAVAADKNSEYGSFHKLGGYTLAHVGDGKMVINLYTQFYPGKDLDLDALALGFKNIRRSFPNYYKIGIPEIGCGIAGGVWDQVKEVIENRAYGMDITHVEYHPPMEEDTKQFMSLGEVMKKFHEKEANEDLFNNDTNNKS